MAAPLKLLFVADPLGEFRTYKDSTYAMMVEAARRGHAIAACEIHELSLEDGRVLATHRAIELADTTGTRDDWWRPGPDAVASLETFDAVLMRKDPPFDQEFLYATYMLEHATRHGASVFNAPRALRDHNEKFAIAEFPQFTAPTIITRDPAKLRAFVDAHGEAVFKLLDGMGGASIFRASRGDPNLSVIVETMNRFGARSVMAQRYLPEIVDGDKRVLLIGGEVVPFALARIPKAGEARGNLAAGGTGRAQPLSARDREIAEALAPQLFARGLLLVGLDVIGDCLTEINVTSPTCFAEIARQTGFSVAGMFVDAVERSVSTPA